jgi:hypothetical protein
MKNLENMSVKEIDELMTNIEVLEIPAILAKLKSTDPVKYANLMAYNFREFFKESYNYPTKSSDNHSPLSHY